MFPPNLRTDYDDETPQRDFDMPGCLSKTAESADVIPTKHQTGEVSDTLPSKTESEKKDAEESPETPPPVEEKTKQDLLLGNDYKLLHPSEGPYDSCLPYPISLFYPTIATQTASSDLLHISELPVQKVLKPIVHERPILPKSVDLAVQKPSSTSSEGFSSSAQPKPTTSESSVTSAQNNAQGPIVTTETSTTSTQKSRDASKAAEQPGSDEGSTQIRRDISVVSTQEVEQINPEGSSSTRTRRESSVVSAQEVEQINLEGPSSMQTRRESSVVSTQEVGQTNPEGSSSTQTHRESSAVSTLEIEHSSESAWKEISPDASAAPSEQSCLLGLVTAAKSASLHEVFPASSAPPAGKSEIISPRPSYLISAAKWKEIPLEASVLRADELSLQSSFIEILTSERATKWKDTNSETTIGTTLQRFTFEDSPSDKALKKPTSESSAASSVQGPGHKSSSPEDSTASTQKLTSPPEGSPGSNRKASEGSTTSNERKAAIPEGSIPSMQKPATSSETSTTSSRSEAAPPRLTTPRNSLQRPVLRQTALSESSTESSGSEGAAPGSRRFFPAPNSRRTSFRDEAEEKPVEAVVVSCSSASTSDSTDAPQEASDMARQPSIKSTHSEGKKLEDPSFEALLVRLDQRHSTSPTQSQQMYVEQIVNELDR